MTYEASHTSHGHADAGGAWILPTFGSALLTLIWGAYTLYVIGQLLPIAMPVYPG